MSFLGKTYRAGSEENVEAFVKVLGLPAEMTAKLVQYKPDQKFEKDGDAYKHTVITANKVKEIRFKSGETYDDKLRDLIPVKITYTVDGDTITQVIKDDEGRSGTFKMEFSGDTMKATVTASFWDGTAVRHYSAI
ncbi:fatty acid-binding protein 1-like [Galleria mellonella]|uniref:Fatty acid-binding protein 1-like n=1 Tax=Galleria mellonella TaxID=7137 RepID=A0A6J3BXG7_GALME|nr:fatty acid-binding protein 1-like [Galleria mellonella]